MRNLKKFKKYEIVELNKVKGGGICWETQGTDVNSHITDVWYLFPCNNYTGDDHTDYVGSWH